MVKKSNGAAAGAEGSKAGRSADATAKGWAKAAATQHQTAVLAKDVAAGKKQARDEIDDLFGGLKAAKKQKDAANAAAAAEEPVGGKNSNGGGKKEGKQKVEGSKDDLFGTEATRGRK